MGPSKSLEKRWYPHFCEIYILGILKMEFRDFEIAIAVFIEMLEKKFKKLFTHLDELNNVPVGKKFARS
jgi:hypothetical protein